MPLTARPVRGRADCRGAASRATWHVMPRTAVFACTVYVSGEGVGPLARIESSSCTVSVAPPVDVARRISSGVQDADAGETWFCLRLRDRDRDLAAGLGKSNGQRLFRELARQRRRLAVRHGLQQHDLERTQRDDGPIVNGTVFTHQPCRVRVPAIEVPRRAVRQAPGGVQLQRQQLVLPRAVVERQEGRVAVGAAVAVGLVLPRDHPGSTAS